MAVANFTGDENEQTFEQLVCRSEGLTTELHGQLIFLSVLNIFLSVTAFLGNILILAALRKESSLHPPSKLLFRTLTTTDLFVGLITEPLDVSFLISLLNERWNICHHANVARFIAGHLLCGVSLLTLTAISVDRLFALLLKLRYRQVVTLKRTNVIVIAFWVFGTVFTAVWFLDGRITAWSRNIIISLCLLTSIVSYTTIFVTLRHHQTQDQSHVQQEQPSQANPLNIARYKKAVSSALWIQLTLVSCYLPYGLLSALWPNTGISLSIFLAGEYTLTLIYLNSSLNPILYCWKIREVRQAVKVLIRQLFC